MPMNSETLAVCVASPTLKWYEYNQNNSGGHFDADKSVCHRLFVQAENADAANSIAESLGVYFDGVDDGRDCECCGDRWYRQDTAVKFPMKYSDTLTFNTIEEYAQYVAKEHGWTDPDCRLFYANGLVTDVYRAKKPKRMR